MRTNSNVSEDHSAAPIAIAALGAFDGLVAELEQLARGNGRGNGGDGGGHDGGGDGGGDPYDAPATIKMLLDAARQMANFQSDLTLRTAETLTEAIVKGREAGQQQLIEIAKQLHENNMRAMEASTRATSAAADRFEALEARIGMLERALGRSKLPENGAGDDAGGGP